MGVEFSFVHITDHHLTASDAELVNGFSTRHAFRAVLRHIARNAGGLADFIVSTGDLVERPSEAGYRAVVEMLDVRNAAAMPGPLFVSAEGLRDMPMYLLPGNHDDRVHFAECLFPASRPAPLLNVAFRHQGTQFICLDWGPDAKAAAHPEMLDFLARSLAADGPSIILMHHQLIAIGSRWLDDLIADDVARFWDVVGEHPVLAVLCGHVHTTYERVVHGIPVLGLRSTAPPFVLQDEPLACLLPPHYRLVTVRNGLVTTRVVEVPL